MSDNTSWVSSTDVWRIVYEESLDVVNAMDRWTLIDLTLQFDRWTVANLTILYYINTLRITLKINKKKLIHTQISGQFIHNQRIPDIYRTLLFWCSFRWTLQISGQHVRSTNWSNLRVHREIMTWSIFQNKAHTLIRTKGCVHVAGSRVVYGGMGVILSQTGFYSIRTYQ